MKLKTMLIALAALLAAPGAAFSAGLPAQEVNCAAEEMQLLYYYLAPDPGASVKERPTRCQPGKASVKMPAWIEKELPGMRERLVWTDPEEGKLSEAALWQTSVSILYELAETTRKTLPPAQGGAGLKPGELETAYQDMRIRFMMSADRITRTGLEKSLGGRGGSALSALNSIMEKLDQLTAALSSGDMAGFEKGAAGAMKLSRGLFAQFFGAPAAGAAGVIYKPEARTLPGYRGVSLKVSGSQAMFLKAGDRADMLVTFEAIMGAGTKEKVTATILQNVVVLKVHKPAASSEPGVVQLLCNPNEAQYAALSLAQGSNITITRRAEGDLELRPMEIASFRKLIK